MAAEKKGSGNGNGGSPGKSPKIEWDSSQLKNSYANVCNVTSTREEVVLLFGLNQSFTGAGDTVSVQLNNRIILSPFAAKRLSELLSKALNEYETAFGKLAEPGK